MILNKTNLIVFLVGVFLGLCTGFFTAKAIYDQPIEESVKTDTITIHDTIPDLNPTPKDSARIRWVTRWLPMNPGADHVADVGKMMDSINQLIGVNNVIHDTVAVQVPITSKHFSGKNYDAYVSGFEPNLDSIKVYTETKVITNTITKVKSPNKWELDVVGGIDYNTAQDKYTPYAVGELLYKPSRLQLGIQGGIIKAGKVEPVVGAKIKYRIL